MAKRPARPVPTSLRLAPAEVARLDALRGPMSEAASLAADAVSRHAVLLAVIREGLAVLEKRHGTAPRARGR